MKGSNLFEAISNECQKYTYCADCPFIDYDNPKHGTCIFMKAPEIWDCKKIYEAIIELSYPGTKKEDEYITNDNAALDEAWKAVRKRILKEGE